MRFRPVLGARNSAYRHGETFGLLVGELHGSEGEGNVDWYRHGQPGARTGHPWQSQRSLPSIVPLFMQKLVKHFFLKWRNEQKMHFLRKQPFMYSSQKFATHFLQNHLFDLKCYRGPPYEIVGYPQIYPDEFAIFVALKTDITVDFINV